MSDSMSKDELKKLISEIVGTAAREYTRGGAVKPHVSAVDIADSAASVIIDAIPEFPNEDLASALEQLREALLPLIQSMQAHAGIEEF